MDIAVDYGKEGWSGVQSFFNNVFASLFGTDLTDQQRMMLAANQQYNSAEAEKAFQRTLYLDSTKYQRQVADMQSAGINPMFIGGNISSPSVQAASSTASPGSSGVNLGSLIQLLGLRSQINAQNAQARLANSEAAKNIAEKENVQADTEQKKEHTRGARLANDFFEKTENLREVLLGKESEQYDWQRDVAERDVTVKENAQKVVQEQAQHYNDYLDKLSDLVSEQKETEGVKREELKAIARESNASAAYKRAMIEVDKKYTEAKTDTEKEQYKLLQIEARLKNGVYSPQYIEAVARAANAEADLKETIAAYERGDYSRASKSLQRMFHKLEKDGLKGTYSTTYFGSSNAAASASALPIQ